MLTEDAMYFLLSVIFVLSCALVGVALLVWDVIRQAVTFKQNVQMPMWKFTEVYETKEKDND